MNLYIPKGGQTGSKPQRETNTEEEGRRTGRLRKGWEQLRWWRRRGAEGRKHTDEGRTGRGQRIVSC